MDGGNVGISLTKCHKEAKPVFRFQKRAHYVSPASESQFRGLDLWAEKNARALRTLLRMPLSNFVRSSVDLWRSLHRSMAQFFTLTESLLHRTMQLRENNTPTRNINTRTQVRGASDRPAKLGQRIVFGEWLAAKHSKSYSFLPDVFLIFDIFDSSFFDGRGGFVSANVRDEMLRYTCFLFNNNLLVQLQFHTLV